MHQTKTAKYIIASFALIKLLVPFLFIHQQFELHRDEYLYLADSDHLAWGFIEMPPLLAVLGYISKLMGGTVHTVQLWGGVFGAFTMVFVGEMVIRLKGNAFAIFMACLGFLCTGLLRMNILFQPNFLDIFFWTASSYFIVCWLDTDKTKYLYWLGLCFGLGILGKYTTAFYIFSFLVAVILLKRSALANKHLYFAMLLGFAICSPNLVWQYQHHFPVLHHMDLLTNQQLKHNSRVLFLADQLLITFPSFFLWLGGIWYLFLNKSVRHYLFLILIYFGILSILLFFNGKAYYAAAMYPTLMVFGGIWFSKINFGKRFGWLRVAVPVCMMLITAFVLPMILPCMSADKLAAYYKAIRIDKGSVLQWEDHQEHSLPQDFSDMLGWDEMAKKTARVYSSLPDSVKNQTMVYGDNYGEAGALSFYRKKYGLPEIYSDDASYLFWLPDHFTQKYFLFVCKHLPDADDAFFNHWNKREIKDSVTEKLAREFGTKIILYSQPDDSVRVIAERNMLESRKQFNFK